MFTTVPLNTLATKCLWSFTLPDVNLRKKFPKIKNKDEKDQYASKKSDKVGNWRNLFDNALDKERNKKY